VGLDFGLGMASARVIGLRRKETGEDEVDVMLEASALVYMSIIVQFGHKWT